MTTQSMPVNEFLKSVFPENVKAHITPKDIDFALPEDGVLSSEQTDCLKMEGFMSDKIQTIHQIHSDIVLKAPLPDYVDWEGDGIITDEPGLVLTIRTADCLPVFLWDKDHDAVGLVHAGWRGTQQKIVVKALSAMFEAYGTKPESLIVAFGPSISSEYYEVGSEFKENFSQETIEKDGKYFFNLCLANQNQLTQQGVMDKNIHNGGFCTFSNEQFFSYRRQGKESNGRFLSAIMLKEKV